MTWHPICGLGFKWHHHTMAYCDDCDGFRPLWSLCKVVVRLWSRQTKPATLGTRGGSSKNRLVTIYFSIETMTHSIKETIDLGSGDTRGSIDVRSAAVAKEGRSHFFVAIYGRRRRGSGVRCVGDIAALEVLDAVPRSYPSSTGSGLI